MPLRELCIAETGPGDERERRHWELVVATFFMLRMHKQIAGANAAEPKKRELQPDPVEQPHADRISFDQTSRLDRFMSTARQF